MAPRSRMPLSPSMEARLSSSQDSLISTGSNQELKTQLDSTLAEVEAIAEHLEKQKKPPLEKSTSDTSRPISKKSLNDPPKPTVRRKASEQIPDKPTAANGARPRERASISSTSPPNPIPRASMSSASASDVSAACEPVMLRQGSWASREHINSSGKAVGGEKKNFGANKTLWESRTSATSGGLPAAGSGGGEVGVRGGFRSNRDFWNQRTAIQQKQKQTPDLVLDLPASGTAPKPKPRPRGGGQPSTADSLSSSNSSSGDENLAAADQFANPDRNTLRKSSTKSSPDENGSSPPGSLNKSQKIPPVQARLQKKSPPK